MQRLARLPIQQLRARYREVYGEESHSGHRQHLVRRERLLFLEGEGGGLHERALRRVAQSVDWEEQERQFAALVGSVGAAGALR